MKRCLRKLIGKIDIKKLTDEEWDIIAKAVDEYAFNSVWVGFLVGVIIVVGVIAIAGLL